MSKRIQKTAQNQGPSSARRHPDQDPLAHGHGRFVEDDGLVHSSNTIAAKYRPDDIVFSNVAASPNGSYVKHWTRLEMLKFALNEGPQPQRRQELPSCHFSTRPGD